MFPCRHVCVCQDCFLSGLDQNSDDDDEDDYDEEDCIEQLEKCFYCRQEIEDVYNIQSLIE